MDLQDENYDNCVGDKESDLMMRQMTMNACFSQVRILSSPRDGHFLPPLPSCCFW